MYAPSQRETALQCNVVSHWLGVFTKRSLGSSSELLSIHDDVIKWKHFPRYWPFVQGIHRSPVNSPHKGQWCGALMFPLICAWINGWAHNREAGDLRRHHAHYDIIVMCHWTKANLQSKFVWWNLKQKKKISFKQCIWKYHLQDNNSIVQAQMCLMH